MKPENRYGHCFTKVGGSYYTMGGMGEEYCGMEVSRLDKSEFSEHLKWLELKDQDFNFELLAELSSNYIDQHIKQINELSSQLIVQKHQLNRNEYYYLETISSFSN